MTEKIVVDMPDRGAIAEADVAPVLRLAKAVVITNAAEHERAQHLYLDIKRSLKVVEEKTDPSVKAGLAAHRAALALRKELTDPLEAAKNIVGKAITGYEAEQRRRAEEEAARLAEEARRQAEAEAAAERERLRREEEDRRLAEAAAAEAAWNVEEAEAILEEPMPEPDPEPPPLPAPVIRVDPGLSTVAGIGRRETWNVEVTDLVALLFFVASNPSWIHLVKADEVELRKLARAQKGAFAIPGVRAFAESGLSAKT